MKKFAAIVLVMLLAISMLAGCGGSFAADESTVFVRKNGKIISTDVEDFNETDYDKDGLKKYAKDAISDYNKKNGKNLVKLKSLSVKDKKAVMTLEYASSLDYQKFNDIELFTGNIAEALAAGYTFDCDFAVVKDGKITSCKADEFLKDSGYQVVVIKGNLNIKVPGNILYLSTVNTGLVDKKTVSVKEGTSLLKEAASTEDTQKSTEVLSTEVTQTEGAVSDDDLLTASTEEKMQEFHFDEKDEKEESEFSQVYTYIIYK